MCTTRSRVLPRMMKPVIEWAIGLICQSGFILSPPTPLSSTDSVNVNETVVQPVSHNILSFPISLPSDAGAFYRNPFRELDVSSPPWSQWKPDSTKFFRISQPIPPAPTTRTRAFAIFSPMASPHKQSYELHRGSIYATEIDTMQVQSILLFLTTLFIAFHLKRIG